MRISAVQSYGTGDSQTKGAVGKHAIVYVGIDFDRRKRGCGC